VREETEKRVNKAWTLTHEERLWETTDELRRLCYRTTQPGGNVNVRCWLSENST
jgi:hypothetical protein